MAFRAIIIIVGEQFAVIITFKEDLSIEILRNDTHLAIRKDLIKVFMSECLIIKEVNVKCQSLNVIVILMKGFKRVID